MKCGFLFGTFLLLFSGLARAQYDDTYVFESVNTELYPKYSSLTLVSNSSDPAKRKLPNHVLVSPVQYFNGKRIFIRTKIQYNSKASGQPNEIKVYEEFNPKSQQGAESIIVYEVSVNLYGFERVDIESAQRLYVLALAETIEKAVQDNPKDTHFYILPPYQNTRTRGPFLPIGFDNGVTDPESIKLRHRMLAMSLTIEGVLTAEAVAGLDRMFYIDSYTRISGESPEVEIKAINALADLASKKALSTFFVQHVGIDTLYNAMEQKAEQEYSIETFHRILKINEEMPHVQKCDALITFFLKSGFQGGLGAYSPKDFVEYFNLNGAPVDKGAVELRRHLLDTYTRRLAMNRKKIPLGMDIFFRDVERKAKDIGLAEMFYQVIKVSESAAAPDKYEALVSYIAENGVTQTLVPLVEKNLVDFVTDADFKKLGYEERFKRITNYIRVRALENVNRNAKK